jgi:hypothetical protein
MKTFGKSSVRGAMLIVITALFAALPDSVYANGTVTHLSGTLYVKKGNGTLKTLSEMSIVEQGDLLVSGKATYARIRFTDDSELSLGPDSRLSIERFSFDETNPKDDEAAFSLIKGKVHSIGGRLGKRSAERSELRTPLGTIGIGAASVIVEYAAPTKTAAHTTYRPVIFAALEPSLIDYRLATSDAQNEFVLAQAAPGAQLTPQPPGAGGLAPGLYVHVIDGIINLSNKGGSQNFTAGQFGYTASFVKPPVVVPANPGIQFSPPPAFSSTTSQKSGTGNSGKSNNVDCEVR